MEPKEVGRPPDPDKDTSRPRLPTRRRRALCVLAVIAAVGLAGVVWTATPIAPTTAEAAAVPPGLNPTAQKWLKKRERLQIELNDALVPVVQNLQRPGGAKAHCGRLKRAAEKLTTFEAAPMSRLDQLTKAGLAKFVQGAEACVSGDATAAAQLITDGLAERTATQETFDEYLEGE